MPRACVATFLLVVVAAAAAVQAAGPTKLVVTDPKRRTLQVSTQWSLTLLILPSSAGAEQMALTAIPPKPPQSQCRRLVSTCLKVFYTRVVDPP